jgi:uncharacterized protein (UPF0218 family)
MPGEEDEVLLRLPDDLRAEFKDPMGPVFTDAANLLDRAGEPILAVGDVVTYHLREAGRVPDLAVVDGYTERERADEEIRDAVVDSDVTVENPAATLSAGLLSALRGRLDAPAPQTIVVEGEEDLATVPAVLVAPDGASVVYGQPGEGMVLVVVDPETRERMADLFGRLDGDHDRAREALGLASD